VQKMNPIYKHFRAAYKAGQFSNLRTEVGDDGMCAVYAGSKFLKVYPSRPAAENDIGEQQSRAAKFIQ
jgi:hypothetical protein